MLYLSDPILLLLLLIAAVKSTKSTVENLIKLFRITALIAAQGVYFRFILLVVTNFFSKQENF